ncbi:MAG: transketolase [bacterium]
MNQRGITMLERACRQIRRDILLSTTRAGSGHPTSSLSAVELVVGLLFGGFFRADLSKPASANNDRLLFSKGHAAPLLYAAYAAAGKVSPRELQTLRKFGSRLEGHPTNAFPYTEVPTGSLGQGLAVGCGIALAARMQKMTYRTFVLLGDGELAEGSCWESLAFASKQHLTSLTAIVDVNRLGQSGATMLGRNIQAYVQRFLAFGWATKVIDGHQLPEVLSACRAAHKRRSQPFAIIAKTVKGKGVSFLEKRHGWHGKVLDNKELSHALGELGEEEERIVLKIPQPKSMAVKWPKVSQYALPPQRTMRDMAPRKAFGIALATLANTNARIVALDADVKNSTFLELFEKKHPDRFIQCFIAEQTMVGVATGLATRGCIPIASTFSAFLTRAHDQLRMAGYAGVHLVVAGTHAGVTVGQDGPSQMGLEDIALFRTLFGATVLSPADAQATKRLFALAVRARGIVYLRLMRNPVPNIYTPLSHFTVGGSNVLRSSRHDRVTIIASGITVFFALQAAEMLTKEQISARVIDCYSIQPIDAAIIRKAAQETELIITVEDHVKQGGLGESVRTALGDRQGRILSLAVFRIPKSGTPDHEVRYERIGAEAIVQNIRRHIARKKRRWQTHNN